MGAGPNSANPALGEGQSPGDFDAADGEAEVACAIYCCDQKEYKLKKKRGKNSKTCQRLGNRKHSCVLHKLREKSGDKLTQKNKFKNVLASPRYPNVPGAGRTLIPDTIVGNKVIDAKFPCDPSKVNFSQGSGTVQNLSTAGVPGTSMMGKKEKDLYSLIEGVKEVEAMTPADAAGKRGNCQC